MEGVEEIFGIVMVEGIFWMWESFLEYLDLFDVMECDIDIVVFLLYGLLWVYVMGECGVNCEVVMFEDIEQMKVLFVEGVEVGVMGLFSLCMFLYFSVMGDYVFIFEVVVVEMK